MRMRPLEIVDRGALRRQQAVLDALEMLADRRTGPNSGSRWWMSGTRPARLFSHGSMASSARPSRTASIAASNDSHGSVVMSGKAMRQARSE